MARFFPLLPPRSASFSPQRLRSQSTPNGPKNVLRSLHQQRSQIRIALLADVHLRLALSRVSAVPAAAPDSSPTSRLLRKRCAIFQRQQERQRDQRAYALDLLQQRHLRVALFAQASRSARCTRGSARSPIRCTLSSGSSAALQFRTQSLRLSSDSYSAHCIPAAARRSSWPVHEPC